MSGSMVAVVCLVAVMTGEPEVFSDAGYEADRAAAVEQDRLHLVYATATWCPPCQQMKKTTWVDADVESWVEQHGIVTALDVDEHPQIAGELGVRAMPTMILFEGGEELGRRTGYTGAAELVAWMEAGRNGEELPGPAPMAWEDDGEDTVRPKLDAARDMMWNERYDEATEAYAALWDTMLEENEAYYGVRLSFMAGEMQELASVHEPARERFTELRDREWTELRAGNVDWDTLTDWVHLNGIIGDEHATMEWVERIADRPTSHASFARFDDDITEQATRLERWDIIAIAVPNPTATAREQMQFIQMMGQWDDRDPLEDPAGLDWHFRPAIISALHADDGGVKERELIEYLESACGESDAWRMTFIAIADECGKLRADHKAWRLEHDLDRRYPEGASRDPEF